MGGGGVCYCVLEGNKVSGLLLTVHSVCVLGVALWAQGA